MSGPSVGRAAPDTRGCFAPSPALELLCEVVAGTGRQLANVVAAWCATMLAMSQRSHARDEDHRRRFVADPDVLAALDLKVEQLSDPEVRSFVIRHEHPEFEQALNEGRREIEGGDGPMFLTAQGPVPLRDAITPKTEPASTTAKVREPDRLLRRDETNG